VKKFHLTDAGLAALGAAETVVTDIEQRVCEALGTAKCDQLRDLLDAVIDELFSSPTTE